MWHQAADPPQPPAPRRGRGRIGSLRVRRGATPLPSQDRSRSQRSLQCPHSPFEAPSSPTPPTDVRGPAARAPNMRLPIPWWGRAPRRRRRAGPRESPTRKNAACPVSPAKAQQTRRRCRKGPQSSRISTTVVPGCRPASRAPHVGRAPSRDNEATGRLTWPTPPSHASQFLLSTVPPFTTATPLRTILPTRSVCALESSYPGPARLHIPRRRNLALARSTAPKSATEPAFLRRNQYVPPATRRHGTSPLHGLRFH